MPGLNFGAPKNRGSRPGGWIVPVILLVLSVVLITVSVRVGNSGVFALARSGVQTVSGALQSVCSPIATPFESLNSSSSAMSESEASALRNENEQLRALVAQLEEYRQQDQRLTTLLALSDAYGLETISGNVISTTDGWSRTATVNIGSNDGVEIGMGVMSSCGLYGQVITVSDHTCVIRLISDAASQVSAMVQSTRESGILTGSYDGNLTLDYISVDSNVGVGDVILTSGEGGTYPRGMIIGTVKSVEPDSSRIYYRIAVEPVFNLDSCEEVLILTGNETDTQSLMDMDLLDSIISSIGSSSIQSGTSAFGSVSDALSNDEDIFAAAAKKTNHPQEEQASDATATSNTEGNSNGGEQTATTDANAQNAVTEEQNE